MCNIDKQELLELLVWLEHRLRYYADPSSYEILVGDGPGFAIWDRGITAKQMLDKIDAYREALKKRKVIP